MRQDILGVEVDTFNHQEALEKVKDLLDKGARGYIVTPNPEMVVASQKNKKFRLALNHSLLSLPDGIGLIFAAKLLGKKSVHRTTGVDFTYSLASLAAEHGYKVFFLGGFEKAAEKTAQALQKSLSELIVIGSLSDVLPEKENDDIIKRLTEKEIDILFVALGSPKQELWLAENLHKTKAKLGVGVGGTFDFISARRTRAPGFLSKIGLEWTFRLAQEPWRLRRQLALPHFVLLTVRKKFLSRL